MAQATIGVMVLTLAVLVNVIIFSAASAKIIEDLREKVDISVFFYTEIPEDDILKTKANIETLPEVKKVEYTSRNEALETFKERNKNNPVVIQSLEELEANPLSASLHIKSFEINQLEQISKFIENNFANLIEKVTYRENQDVIARIANFTKSVERAGVIVSLILITIVFFVTFNTIRLTIFNKREEIRIMRLVGASNWFIRGPFLVEGVLYGIVSTVITTLVLLAVYSAVGNKLEGFLMGFNVRSYYLENILAITLIQLVGGVLLGIASSWIAMRRYLEA